MKQLFLFTMLFFGALIAQDSDMYAEPDSAIIDTLITQPRFGVLKITIDDTIYTYVVYMRREWPVIYRRWSWPEITEMRFYDFRTGRDVVLRLDDSAKVGFKQFYYYTNAMTSAKGNSGKYWSWGQQ
jgi:hypothetical protein